MTVLFPIVSFILARRERTYDTIPTTARATITVSTTTTVTTILPVTTTALPATTNAAPQQPRKRRSPLLIGCGIAAGLVVLVIVIVAIVAVASGGGKSAGTASSGNSTTTGNTPASTSSSNAIGKPVSDGSWTVTVNKGGVIKGDVTYQVPVATHDFTFQFTPSLDASQLVEWQIKD